MRGYGVIDHSTICLLIDLSLPSIHTSLYLEACTLPEVHLYLLLGVRAILSSHVSPYLVTVPITSTRAHLPSETYPSTAVSIQEYI